MSGEKIFLLNIIKELSPCLSLNLDRKFIPSFSLTRSLSFSFILGLSMSYRNWYHPMFHIIESEMMC